MGEKHIFDASFAPQNSRPPLRQRPAKRAQLGQRIEGLHGVPFAVADGGYGGQSLGIFPWDRNRSPMVFNPYK